MAAIKYTSVLFYCSHPHNCNRTKISLSLARSVHDICLQRGTVKSYCRAIYLLELLMIKRGILLVPEIVFSAGDINDLMRDMCNDWC